jgi:hypothetical protein
MPPPVGLTPHWTDRRSETLRVAFSVVLRGCDDAAFAMEGQGKPPARSRGSPAPPVNNRKRTGELWYLAIEIPL